MNDRELKQRCLIPKVKHFSFFFFFYIYPNNYFYLKFLEFEEVIANKNDSEDEFEFIA